MSEHEGLLSANQLGGLGQATYCIESHFLHVLNIARLENIISITFNIMDVYRSRDRLGKPEFQANQPNSTQTYWLSMTTTSL